MKKKFLFMGFLPVFAMAGCIALGSLEPYVHNMETQAAEEDDPNQYDYWLNSISKPGHLYLHYNSCYNID